MEQHELPATQAAAAALAALPLMGPRRMAALVQQWGFQGAWSVVGDGSWVRHNRIVRIVGPQAPQLATTWSSAAKDVQPQRLLELHEQAGVAIIPLGSPRFPQLLALDIEPPMVLFAQGDISLTQQGSVGLVGTRAATSSGKQIAFELGEMLASTGINVVSGLALGIDGAAHRGVLTALNHEGGEPGKTIGVVASGLDVIYPKAHNQLWKQVANEGVLISEWPLGTKASRWHFPARNRLIAALSKLVVVVESHARGGSLITAEEAIKRDRLVMAVPGSIRNPASEGSNRLIADGMTPICVLDDVLLALGMEACSPAGVKPSSNIPNVESKAVATSSSATNLDLADAALLENIGWQPIMLDTLAELSGLPLAELSLRLTLLEARGLITRSASAIERVH